MRINDPVFLEENLFDVPQKRHLRGACEGTPEAIKFVIVVSGKEALCYLLK